MHSASQDVVEQSLRYDGEPSCAAALGSSPCAGAAQDPLCWRREVAAGNEGAFANECEVTLTVEANMTAPVYFYYELHEFFQNQRIYVKSQAARQLRGDDWPSLGSYAQYLGSECVDSGHDQCTTGEVPVDGSVPTRYYCNPCGLVARSFFTDTFALEDASGAALEWSQDEVAWPRDREEKFRNTSSGNRFNRRTALENALVTDPDFIVWMRTAALPDFRKLYRRIDRDLVAGETLTLRVRNNYNVTSGGSKRVVLSTMSWIGGRMQPSVEDRRSVLQSQNCTGRLIRVSRRPWLWPDPRGMPPGLNPVVRDFSGQLFHPSSRMPKAKRISSSTVSRWIVLMIGSRCWAGLIGCGGMWTPAVCSTGWISSIRRHLVC